MNSSASSMPGNATPTSSRVTSPSDNDFQHSDATSVAQIIANNKADYNALVPASSTVPSTSSTWKKYFPFAVAGSAALAAIVATKIPAEVFNPLVDSLIVGGLYTLCKYGRTTQLDNDVDLLIHVEAERLASLYEILLPCRGIFNTEMLNSTMDLAKLVCSDDTLTPDMATATDLCQDRLISNSSLHFDLQDGKLAQIKGHRRKRNVRINTLRDLIDKLNCENNKCVIKLSEQYRQNYALRDTKNAEIDDLRTKLREEAQATKALKGEIALRDLTIEELRDEVSSIEAKLETATKANAALNKTNADLNMAKAALEKTNADLRRANASLNTRLNELGGTIDAKEFVNMLLEWQLAVKNAKEADQMPGYALLVDKLCNFTMKTPVEKEKRPTAKKADSRIISVSNGNTVPAKSGMPTKNPGLSTGPKDIYAALSDGLEKKRRSTAGARPKPAQKSGSGVSNFGTGMNSKAKSTPAFDIPSNNTGSSTGNTSIFGEFWKQVDCPSAGAEPKMAHKLDFEASDFRRTSNPGQSKKPTQENASNVFNFIANKGSREEDKVKISSLEAEVTTLKGQLAAKNSEMNNTKGLLARKEVQCEHFAQVIQEHSEKNQRLIQTTIQYGDIIEGDKKEISKLKTDVSVKEQTIQHLQQSGRVLLERAEHAINAAKSEIHSQALELMEQRTVNAVLKNECSVLQARIRAMRSHAKDRSHPTKSSDSTAKGIKRMIHAMAPAVEEFANPWSTKFSFDLHRVNMQTGALDRRPTAYRAFSLMVHTVLNRMEEEGEIQDPTAPVDLDAFRRDAAGLGLWSQVGWKDFLDGMGQPLPQ